jgi:hypothetical protein
VNIISFGHNLSFKRVSSGLVSAVAKKQHFRHGCDPKYFRNGCETVEHISLILKRWDRWITINSYEGNIEDRVLCVNNICPFKSRHWFHCNGRKKDLQMFGEWISRPANPMNKQPAIKLPNETV